MSEGGGQHGGCHYSTASASGCGQVHSSEVPTIFKNFATYPRKLLSICTRADAALDSFKKADKQDAGHCLACQKKMIKVWHGVAGLEDRRTGQESLAVQAIPHSFTMDADGVPQESTWATRRSRAS